MNQQSRKTFFIVLVFIVLVVGVSGFFVQTIFFGAPESDTEVKRYVIPLNSDQNVLIETLETEGFVKNRQALRIALYLKGKSLNDISPGGYRISKSMNAWEIASVISKEPYMKWIVIPEGYRKEQMAELLQDAFNWSDEEADKWVTVDTAMDFDHTEGVYFPDTYLIPVDEEPFKVAERLRAKFNEQFAPLAEEVAQQNIRWTTLLKIASIVQREAAGKDDMPLIAGILWNRLLKGDRLEVDATLQYIKGNKEDGWWPTVKPEDKQLNSPYNTYRNKGLPPHPISNPGITAMKATLYPEKTDCFFYLHDEEGNIHCAKTYEGHKANIEKYLR